MEEVWRPVKGYKGFYEVSNTKKIRSVDRVVHGCYNSTQTKKSAVLTPHLTEKGYYRVVLSKHGIKKGFFLHDLVCWAFPEICGEWFEGAQCNHLNENKTDNRPENLQVTDCKSNINHGTGIKRRAEKKSVAVVQFDIDGNFIKNWVSASEAASVLGIQQSKISACCRGKRKTTGGFKWKYKEK